MSRPPPARVITGWLVDPVIVAYVPPFTVHQHFNDDPKTEARLIVISNRMVKEMGFDWFDQIENAPGY